MKREQVVLSAAAARGADAGSGMEQKRQLG